MPVATSFVSPPLGHSIPYLTPHAVSVSLPTWRDNVGYEEGDKRVVDAMQTGYPRFFVHRSIQKVSFCCRGLPAGRDLGGPSGSSVAPMQEMSK